MKKLFLTSVVALSVLCASAQFRIMSNINEPSDNETWELDNFTNNIAVGYQVNDAVMVGVQSNGDDYNLVGRYNFNKNMYLSAQMPTEAALDNVTLGVGMSIKIWNNLYVEPNYTRTEDEDGFNVGLSYTINN
jgi:opacity protein-like surface antigen